MIKHEPSIRKKSYRMIALVSKIKLIKKRRFIYEWIVYKTMYNTVCIKIHLTN